MSVGLEIQAQLGGKRFKDAARGLEALAAAQRAAVQRVPDVLSRELHAYLDEVRRALLRRHGKPFSNPGNAPATGEANLLRRRGNIRDVRAVVTSGPTVASVSGRLEVPWPLSVHEDGATVRARRAQYLTIPLPAALDARGIPLKPRARDWTNTFVATSRRGNLLIFRREGGRLVPLYLLKREVELPPRLKAEETLAAGEDFFVGRVVEAVVEELSRG